MGIVHNPPIVKHTAVWGGALARMTGQADKWLGIPTGHMTVNVSFGTTIGGPDVTYGTVTTADDLLLFISVIVIDNAFSIT